MVLETRQILTHLRTCDQ